MSNVDVKNSLRLYLKKLLQYFFQGLIVLAPIGITLWVVVGLFRWIDGFLPNLINSLFPDLLEKDAAGNLRSLPGLGFIVVVALVLLVGWISSLFVVGRLVTLLDTVLEKTPGIKFIYSSVKDFLEAFAGNKKKFDKPVLVNVDGTDIWRIGFITQQSSDEFGLKDHVTVYVPHSYAISGITYFVPKEKIKPLPSISAADAMKYTVSGGVTEVE
ncbi:MAG: DUF502 domain-containing protein [Sediminibacterium sp. Gen4]|jgi:uncharacterized membrane protein|uniref:DUF502 domain-containing protein n=1 Tax=unclassified Sediminibacterium TaxID=2635961 RepID=UPI0015BBE3A0|nr:MULTISPECIES: DUF502 domain-containing protein [unclassified Sediminibacterium]MBW0160826.1 DUF502 domain-containing protein [Sediminibacterium sp.]MBW0164364.1 DUF502 domain-containing protein [Sediminibacterium sp.]NWK65237.1 DUF502 domain-containing protein [Sediminibacterium sp. Gen4]